MESLDFPVNAFKNLTDKSPEKRKLATKEIEKIVRTLVEKKNEAQIKKILEYFQNEFINSQQLAYRKGGLLAYSAVAIALMQEESIALKVLGNLVTPILSCMKESEAKVRFMACESMYNLVKVLRDVALVQFNEIFDGLIKVVADTDDEVKKAATALDRLLKDVVTEAASESKYFDLNKFMPIFCERLKAINPGVRQNLTSWLNILDNIPSINLLPFLPQFIRPLFEMLSDNNRDIKQAADNCLMEFLKEVRQNTKDRLPSLDLEVLSILVDISCSKMGSFPRLTALIWICDYLKYYTHIDELQRSSQFPEESYRNPVLKKIFDILRAVLVCLSDDEEEIRKAAAMNNVILLSFIEKFKPSPDELNQIVGVLKEMLKDNRANTTESVLLWMIQLMNKFSSEMLTMMEGVLEKLIEKLTESEESIVKGVVEVLGGISNLEDNFSLVIQKILQFFHKNQNLVNSKSLTIVKKLCGILDPQKVFMAFAEQLQTYNDHKYVSMMVQTLDLILLTDMDLKNVRRELKSLAAEDKSQEQKIKLFETVFKTWSYNPVSTITLCFLSQQYELAYNIIQSFGEIDLDVETLIQIAKLIQLLESPIFVYLRLQLLEGEEYPYLLKSLYGLLMLLPQGKAFNVLRLRLKQIRMEKKEISSPGSAKKKHNVVDVKKLLDLYYDNQKKIRDQPIQQSISLKNGSANLKESTDDIQMNIKEVNLFSDNSITTNKKTIYLE